MNEVKRGEMLDDLERGLQEDLVKLAKGRRKLAELEAQENERWAVIEASAAWEAWQATRDQILELKAQLDQIRDWVQALAFDLRKETGEKAVHRFVTVTDSTKVEVDEVRAVAWAIESKTPGALKLNLSGLKAIAAGLAAAGTPLPFVTNSVTYGLRIAGDLSPLLDGGEEEEAELE